MKVTSEENSVRTTVELVDPTQDAEWDRQVLSHPLANAFHGAAWARVLAKTYGHRPAYLRYTSGDRLLALVPLMEVQSFLRRRRGISLPFSDFCDALIFDPALEEDVFFKLRKVAAQRDWQYIEWRGTACVPASATPAVSFFSHRLDLRGGFETVFRGFRPSVRQALRKIRRTGQLVASIEHSEAAVRAFFHLHVLTRRRHGLPPQPFSFFLNIYREMIAQETGFVVLVRLGKRVVSAMVFLNWEKTAIYKFGASDKSFQELRPNNLAMATAIHFLAEAGYDTLHFGRSSLANAGLRRFKLAWGAIEGTLDYFRYHTSQAAWITTQDHTEGLHTELFRRMPLAINQLAGALLYSHLD